MDTAKELWNRINSLIKDKGTTQIALSVQCEFNARRIQNLSGANRLPDAVEITKIAEALGTTVEYLVTGSDPLRPDTTALISTLTIALEQARSL